MVFQRDGVPLAGSKGGAFCGVGGSAPDIPNISSKASPCAIWVSGERYALRGVYKGRIPLKKWNPISKALPCATRVSKGTVSLWQGAGTVFPQKNSLSKTAHAPHLTRTCPAFKSPFGDIQRKAAPCLISSRYSKGFHPLTPPKEQRSFGNLSCASRGLAFRFRRLRRVPSFKISLYAGMHRPKDPFTALRRCS